MKADYTNIPTWCGEYALQKTEKNRLIKLYHLEERKNVNFRLYRLSDKLTHEEKLKLLDKFNNIDFYATHHGYAPEIKNNVILVCSHKITPFYE